MPDPWSKFICGLFHPQLYTVMLPITLAAFVAHPHGLCACDCMTASQTLAGQCKFRSHLLQERKGLVILSTCWKVAELDAQHLLPSVTCQMG